MKKIKFLCNFDQNKTFIEKREGKGNRKKAFIHISLLIQKILENYIYQLRLFGLQMTQT